jgi:NAD+ synthase
MVKINPGKIKRGIVQFIQRIVKDNEVIIGLSGGIDSSITAALAVKALGNDKVKALIMKNDRYSTKNLEVSRNYANSLGIEVQEVDSTRMRNEAIIAIDIDENNIVQFATMDARICDTLIRTYAGIENRIYLGTINGTERLTGWYPKGALVGDLCPIGGLLKEQEKILVKYLGLDNLIETISYDSSKICNGCGELFEFKGIPYSTLDKVLYMYETLTAESLPRRLRDAGINPETFSIILKRIHLVNHKDDVFPDYYKINYMGNLNEK